MTLNRELTPKLYGVAIANLTWRENSVLEVLKKVKGIGILLESELWERTIHLRMRCHRWYDCEAYTIEVCGILPHSVKVKTVMLYIGEIRLVGDEITN